MWGMILRDDLMALDYPGLAARKWTPTRIGVTGMSMGSTRSSWWLMALDKRIKTAVCVACKGRAIAT